MRTRAFRLTALVIAVLTLTAGLVTTPASAAGPLAPGAFVDGAALDPGWTRSCSAPYIDTSAWFEVQICVEVQLGGLSYRPAIILRQVYEATSQPIGVPWVIEALNYGVEILHPNPNPSVTSDVLCNGLFLPHDYKICHGPQLSKRRRDSVGAVDPQQYNPVYSPKLT